MNKRKVTIKDIAEKAGVSSSTVSMVLNGRNKFPEKTCRKVIDACNELGYFRSTAVHNAEIDDKVLVAVVPVLCNEFCVQAVGAMQKRAKECGYSLMVYETMRERTLESRIIQICSTFPFAGVIFVYPPENSFYMKHLETQKPVVHIYDKDVFEDESTLEVDGLKIGYEIGKYLVSLDHVRIAYLSLDFEKRQILRNKRLNGIRQAYKEKGFDPDESVVLCTPQKLLPNIKKTPEGYDLGYQLMKRIIEQNSGITAVACMNDMIAVGAMDAVIDAGLKIPDDYSICGCDNTNISKYRGISLTTIDSYPALSGRDAVDYIIRRIEDENYSMDEENGADGVTRIEYYPKLIIRKTTGPKKENRL